jgi:hypothetical protein
METIMTRARFGRLAGAFLLVLTAAGAVSLAIRSAGAQDKSAQDDKNAKVQLMFVQTSEGIKVDPAAKTLRLVDVNKQTLYFSDRPERIAGHLRMDDYLKEWTAKAGKDNFSANPPNAALSVYEPKQDDSTLAVVVLTNPVVEKADLVYNYKLISGKLPTETGPTTLFIDWIGVGGGVGFGYHGVGVGARGFGVRR